jgi:hypothetical protein
VGSPDRAGNGVSGPAGRHIGIDVAVLQRLPCARRLLTLAVGMEECSRRGSNKRMEPS